jgi:hypothetical protein
VLNPERVFDTAGFDGQKTYSASRQTFVVGDLAVANGLVFVHERRAVCGFDYVISSGNRTNPPRFKQSGKLLRHPASYWLLRIRISEIHSLRLPLFRGLRSLGKYLLHDGRKRDFLERQVVIQGC